MALTEGLLSRRAFVGSGDWYNNPEQSGPCDSASPADHNRGLDLFHRPQQCGQQYAVSHKRVRLQSQRSRLPQDITERKFPFCHPTRSQTMASGGISSMRSQQICRAANKVKVLPTTNTTTCEIDKERVHLRTKLHYS